MRPVILLALAAGALALGGCQKPVGSPAAGNAFSPKGRFVGIGIYAPGRMWTQLTRAVAADPAAATLDDDEQVIVVLDSKTGEIRQCGSLSGHCLAMNPWSAKLPAAQQTPVPVARHDRQLTGEADAEFKRQQAETKDTPGGGGTRLKAR